MTHAIILLGSRASGKTAVSQRPSLTGLSMTEESIGIIKEHAPLYQESAYYIIDASKDKTEVLQPIYRLCVPL